MKIFFRILVALLLLPTLVFAQAIQYAQDLGNFPSAASLAAKFPASTTTIGDLAFTSDQGYLDQYRFGLGQSLCAGAG